MKFLKKAQKYFHHINRKGLLFLVCFFCLSFFLMYRYVDMELVRIYIAENPFWAPFFLILLKAGTVIIAPLSGTVVYATAWALFPFRKAFLYIVIGNILWMTGSFYLGRRYGDRVITFIFGKKWDKHAHRIFDRLGNWKWLFLARIFLFPIEDLINYVAWMTKISYWSFVWVSTLVTSVWVLPWLFGIDKILSIFGL